MTGNTATEERAAAPLVPVPPREFFRCKYCRFLDREDFIRQNAKNTNFLSGCRMCGNASDFIDPTWMMEEEKQKILSGWYEDYDNLERDRAAGKAIS